MSERCPSCGGPLIGGTHVVRIGDDWAPSSGPEVLRNRPGRPTAGRVL